jgi:branched-chain amino acid transport system permease protein
MTLLGGVGTILGPVVGAFLLITVQTYLAEVGAWVTVIQGVIFVVCVMAFRRGIVGEAAAWLERRRRQAAKPLTAPPIEAKAIE